MDDLISRWEAINALERKKDKNAKGDVGGFYNRIIQNDIDALMQLPSAQPQRVRGRWKRTYLDLDAMGERSSIFYCSECSQCIAFPTNYCPSCGADMRGEQECTKNI